MSDSERDALLNYDVKDLIEKIVEFHREQKFSYPPNFKFSEELKIGDKVIFSTKRGEKEGVIDSDNGDNTYDIDIKADVVEDIPLNKIRLKDGKKVDLEPFNPFTKDKSKLFALADFQDETDESFYGTQNRVGKHIGDFNE